MTREEIIQGLQFTIDMFLLDPNTGETFIEPRNDTDKTTIDACRGVIELLEQESCEDAISRQAVLEIVEREQYKGDALQEIEKLSFVKQQEQKTGHWIFDDECKEHGHCSHCGYGRVDLVDGEPHNFCRNCGATMVKLQKSEDEE